MNWQAQIPELPLPGRVTQVSGMFWTPSNEFIKELSSHLNGKRVLEVFAGNGYLAAWLKKNGVSVKATSILSGMDAHKKGVYSEVENIDAVEAVRKHGEKSDVLLYCWPTTTEKAIQAARLWGKEKEIIFIGEATDYSKGFLGGCATDSFFEEIEFKKHFSSYSQKWFEIAAVGFLK